MSRTPQLVTDRLELEPLREDHAMEMVAVLADRSLYRYTGGEPPTEEGLTALYRNQVAGSGDEHDVWHNWIVRLDGTAVGVVQASVSPDQAALAWVVGVPWQGRGIATEAADAVRDWVVGEGATVIVAFIHADNASSNAVAARLGMDPTGVVDKDGEMIWKRVMQSA